MNKRTYLQPKTCNQFDATHVLVYLNEEVIDNYVPEDAPEGFEPTTGYAYSGEMPDGGTLIMADANNRDSLINGIIRATYSQTEEDAIKTHQLIRLEDPECSKAEKYAEEWETFKVCRENAINLVNGWLGNSEE